MKVTSILEGEVEGEGVDLTEEVSVRAALMRNVVAGEEGERDRVNWVTERN